MAIYRYIIVGEKLYRIRDGSGESWYESNGQWLKIEEAK